MTQLKLIQQKVTDAIVSKFFPNCGREWYKIIFSIQRVFNCIGLWGHIMRIFLEHRRHFTFYGLQLVGLIGKFGYWIISHYGSTWTPLQSTNKISNIPTISWSRYHRFHIIFYICSISFWMRLFYHSATRFQAVKSYWLALMQPV